MSEDELNIESMETVHVEASIGVKERRRAKTIVSEAILSATTPLDNRSQKERMLPGLWYAAMNILIEFMEINDVMSVLTFCSHEINGTRENADSPIRTISNKAMSSYIEEVVGAGQTIVECLMPALEKMEKEGLDDLFPETVLASALTVLQMAWGPDHVRRAISEQTALFIRGIHKPANFMEPETFIVPTTPTVQQVHKAELSIDRDVSPISSAVLNPVCIKPLSLESRIDAFILSDVSEKGLNGWSVWITSNADNRFEERLISGIVQDPSGRLGWVHGVHQCLFAIALDAERVVARVEIANEVLLNAINKYPGTRLPAEQHIWDDIDRISELHDIEFKFQQFTLSKSYIEKSEMKIRRLLSEM